MLSVKFYFPLWVFDRDSVIFVLVLGFLIWNLFIGSTLMFLGTLTTGNEMAGHEVG